MFSINMKERNEKEITLKDVHGEDLKVLVDFCYTGSLHLNIINVYTILSAASQFDFIDVEKNVLNF